MSTTPSLTHIPLLYRLFFLYIEPISAILGASYAALAPATYLNLLTLNSQPLTPPFIPTALPTQVSISLAQLANLYLLFALNEHFVLSSTSSVRTWRRLLFGLLLADLGHLATMAPLGTGVFWHVWEWNAMCWGSVPFVYVGATMRMCFLAGVGMGGRGKERQE